MILEVENTLFEALRNLFKEKTYETKNGMKNLTIARAYTSFENIDKSTIVYPCILVKFDEDTSLVTKEKEDKSLKYHFFISTDISNNERAYEAVISIYEHIKNIIAVNGRIGNIIVDKKNMKGVLSDKRNEPYMWMDMSVQITNAILNTNLKEERFYVWKYGRNRS